MPTNARELAFVVLDESKRSSTFVTQLLEEALRDASLAPRERPVAMELVYGIVRRQATLNALIEPHVTRPRHKIEGALWTLLQLGAYQLVFMDSVPPHAAVNETVETARRFGKPRWTGFINGVLRSVDRDLTGEFTAAAAADAIPLSEGRYPRCRRPVFPDPDDDPAGYFARAFSFPVWLAERWRERFDLAELARMGFWFNAPAKICLRVNLLRTSRGELLTAMHEAGVQARPSHLPEAVWLESPARIDELPGYEKGWFSVQDPSAMHAARLLSPGPGAMVLDMCAGPGTKTTQLAELMRNEGRIFATDIHSERLARVEENARRLGITIINPLLIRPDGSDTPAGPFDAVLVDVPCSNTGVLGKRPDARWRIRPTDLEELPALQKRLLLTACDRLKPGGRVVYSTCSIEPEENADVVRAVLAERPALELNESIEHVPGRPADGAYQALLAAEVDRAAAVP